MVMLPICLYKGYKWSNDGKVGVIGFWFLFCAITLVVGWCCIYQETGIAAPEGTPTSEPNAVYSTERGFYPCLYFSLITWTTLGYGDYRPVPSTECRLLAALQAFSGYAYMALAIGLLLNALQRSGERGHRPPMSAELDSVDIANLEKFLESCRRLEQATPATSTEYDQKAPSSPHKS